MTQRAILAGWQPACCTEPVADVQRAAAKARRSWGILSPGR